MTEPPKSSFRPWLWVIGLGAAAAAGLAYLAGRFPDALDDGTGRMRLVYGVALLAFLGGTALLHRRTPPGHAVRNILVWLAVGAVLFAGYGYRHELSAVGDRLMGELVPHRGVETAAGAIRVSADKSGHFVVEAEVDGVPIRFLVDTGASDVVLSPRDAERLGFDVKALAYTRSYRTANGVVLGAPVRLGRVAIGAIALTEVRASVNGAPMNRSLLGMSFLGRLGGYEVSRDTLTLRR